VEDGELVPNSHDKLKCIGFLINPIAGLGGRVGLKGTDGVADEARSKGAKPVAPHRALTFLRRVSKRLTTPKKIRWITCPPPMGAEELNAVDLQVEVLPLKLGEQTSAADTKLAVQRFLDKGVQLIVFVGGDGTARDILDVVADNPSVLVLGVPAGVKMYSGIFAFSPEAAAQVVVDWIEGETQVQDFEIMDADEEAIREDQFMVKLYGYLKGPLVPARMQGSKLVTPDSIDERQNQEAVARTVIEDMKDGGSYIFGPGTTVKTIADLLGVEKTLLGVDLYQGGEMVLDVNEQQLLEMVPDFLNAWIVVSPIGHQGMLLGRGNQQISPNIIRKIPPEQIIVVATQSKVNNLAERGLHVDTGDTEIDRLLSGYIRVLVDYRTWRMIKVNSNASP
jgi:predicted polyphosphate/ATP-dependent NAD kinase